MKLKARVGALIFLLGLFVSSGCSIVLGPYNIVLGPATSTKEAIDQSEKKWLDQKIRNYQIEVHYFTLGTEIFTTTLVDNGKVVDAKCKVGTMFENSGRDQCAWFLNTPETFTAPELFNSARSLVFQADSLPNEMKVDAVVISFDPQYGFPSKIVWQPPEYTEWEVLSFKVLP